MPYQYMPGYQPYYQPPMADQLAQLRGAQYQPIPQQIPQVQPQQAQTGGQSMVWVSGEQEAMGYLVAPNSAVALWDSNAPTIYLKQADASGKPSIKVYDLVERNAPRTAPAAPQAAPVEYATKQDLEALAARVEALSAKEKPAKRRQRRMRNEPLFPGYGRKQTAQHDAAVSVLHAADAG